MKFSDDPFMKSQQVNMMLKANDMDLENFCMSAGINKISLQSELGRAGISYDPVTRQFKT